MEKSEKHSYLQHQKMLQGLCIYWCSFQQMRATSNSQLKRHSLQRMLQGILVYKNKTLIATSFVCKILPIQKTKEKLGLKCEPRSINLMLLDQNRSHFIILYYYYFNRRGLPPSPPLPPPPQTLCS